MPLVTPTPDEIDDLIYTARIGSLPELQSDLSTLSSTHSTTQSVLIASAIDSLPESEGGSGCCLLHYPAANGHNEILSHLTSLLSSGVQNGELTSEEVKNVINHRNHSGNTALHWAALNIQLEAVKVLVTAGADVAVKNEAGLDAVFLAERAGWKAGEESQKPSQNKEEEKEEDEEVEVEIGGEEGGGADTENAASDAGPKSKGREVVEWLLAHGESVEGQGQGAQAQGSSEEL